MQDDTLSKVQEMRREAENGNRDQRERMQRCRRFKIGEQWDWDVKEYMKAKRQHALTINRILPTVLHVSGLHSQNRKDLHMRPTKGATQTGARILSSLLKHCLTDSRFNQEHDKAFEDAITTGCGYLYVYLDYRDDPRNGNLRVKKVNPFSVYTDPSAEEYNQNVSGRYMIWDEWVDEDKLKLEYPDKADDIGGASYGDEQAQGAFRSILNFMFRSRDEGYSDAEGEMLEESRKHKVKLTHTWWIEYRTCAYLYEVGADDMEPIKLVEKAQISKAKAQAKLHPNVLTVVERVEKYLHHTLNVGDVLLEDIENPYAYQEQPKDGVMQFPIIPIFPYFEDGYCYGIVQNLIGPQEEHNSSRSAMLNITKKLANVGWIGKGLGQKFRDWLGIHSGEDGIVIDVPANADLKKIEQTALPNNYTFIAERSAQDIQEIAHIRLEQPDFDSKAMSGRAIALKQQSSLTGSGPLFANDEHSTLILGEFLVELIRMTPVYSESEIRAICDEDALVDERLMRQAMELLEERYGLAMPEPPSPNIAMELEQFAGDKELTTAYLQEYQSEVETYQKAAGQLAEIARTIAEQMLLQEIRTMRVGRYGMIVDEQPHSPTLRMAEELQLHELHRLLVESGEQGIPREQLIEASDIPNKEALLQGAA